MSLCPTDDCRPYCSRIGGFQRSTAVQWTVQLLSGSAGRTAGQRVTAVRCVRLVVQWFGRVCSGATLGEAVLRVRLVVQRFSRCSVWCSGVACPAVQLVVQRGTVWYSVAVFCLGWLFSGSAWHTTVQREVSAVQCVQLVVQWGNVWDSGAVYSAGRSAVQQGVQRCSVWYRGVACGTTWQRVVSRCGVFGWPFSG